MKITELEWGPHPNAEPGMPGYDWGERATVNFPNGYMASCLRGGPFYTKNGTYEIAVCLVAGSIVYDTPVTSDVLGYLSEEEANQALIDIEALPLRARS